MAVSTANRRSVMTLYSGRDDLFSHQTRIVLAEKDVVFEVTFVDEDNTPEDLLQLNPYPDNVPTLVDRELVLFNSRIILEYLDERFPHPPLMPVYPVSRGQSRLAMYRIVKDWYPLTDKILKGTKKESEQARQELKEGILSIAPLFSDTPYFLSDEFGLVDCYLLPLLWRLPIYGIELAGTGAKEIQAYMLRGFDRPSFQDSLTETEREIVKVN